MSNVNPKHYKDHKVSPIDIIESYDLNFSLGCVVKYVARHKEKNGREDLLKGLWFLLKELGMPRAGIETITESLSKPDADIDGLDELLEELATETFESHRGAQPRTADNVIKRYRVGIQGLHHIGSIQQEVLVNPGENFLFFWHLSITTTAFSYRPISSHLRHATAREAESDFRECMFILGAKQVEEL